MWLEDIFKGALASGVNVRGYLYIKTYAENCWLTSGPKVQPVTFYFMNGVLGACLLSLVGMFFVALAKDPKMAPHVVFLFCIGTALTVGINWHGLSQAELMALFGAHNLKFCSLI